MKGVYEAIRTYNGVFALLPEHQERLSRSCMRVGIPVPDLGEVIKAYVREDVKLRVEFFEDGSVNVLETELPPWHGSFLYNEVWKVRVFEGARKMPDLKSTDTEMQARAREEAKADGFDEILLVNDEGNIAEGGITNVYFVKGERIITPGRGMLPGIGRDLVLRACEELGVELDIRDVALSELDSFDAVFLTNSIRGMVPTGPVLPVMERVADWCSAFIVNRINEYRNANNGDSERDAG